MKVLVDFDDVLADTFAELERREGPASDFSAEDLRVMFPNVDISQYFANLEFYGEIPPVPGALEGVSWILDHGHEIQYASARPQEVAAVSQEWLSSLGFPMAPLHCLGREGKKEFLRKDPYDLLIDDQMRYLKIARERGKRAIAVDRRWNGEWDGDRIFDWSEIDGSF